MIDISVIIPIYNVQDYLKKALDSILTENNQNIEVLCIDDGSTDKSKDILKVYESSDPRVKVISKENEGYGRTMNLGIEQARGRYIAILEPDDYIEGEMYRDLMMIADSYDLDYVKSDYYAFEYVNNLYHEWSLKIINNHDGLYEKILTSHEIDNLFYGAIGHWTGLYRKEFLDNNGIRFSETSGASYQDQGFWFQTIVYAKKIYLTKKSYYRYRQDNPNSSMNNISKLYLISDEYDILLTKLKERGKLENYLPYYIMSRFSSHKYTIGRLSYDLKLQFIMRMSEDFNRFKESGLLDVSRMYEADIDYLENIMKSPKEVYEDLLRVPNYIHDLISDYEVFYIYGAGVRCKRIIDSLRSDDKPKLKGLLVSSLDGNLQSIKGYDVEEFGNSNIGSNEAVIVGVAAKYQKEVIVNLKSKGIQNIIEIPQNYV